MRPSIVVACAWLIASALSIGAVRAEVSSTTTALERAAAAWKDLEYDRVIEAADLVIADAAAQKNDRVEAWRWRGVALAVLGRNDEATQAFLQIFPLDPDYQLPDDTSPRILALFRPARATWEVAEQQRLQSELGASLAAMRLAVQTPDRPRGGLPIVITIALTDPGQLTDEIVLGYRRAGARHYASLTVPIKDSRGTATIPGVFTAAPSPYPLELYVRARHRSGATLLRWGTSDQPERIAVAAGQVPVQRKLIKQWWLWTGAAVLVATFVALPFIVNQSVDVGPQTVRFGR